FFQAEDGIRDFHVTGVQTCALPILKMSHPLIRSSSSRRADPKIGAAEADRAGETFSPSHRRHAVGTGACGRDNEEMRLRGGAMRSEERGVGKGGRRRGSGGWCEEKR